jgi:protoporphyrin/coproporphyrin ferrochelatase
MSKTAILLLAHGTPENLDDIPEYLRNITGGRSLPEEAVEEIRHRYSLIPASPLTTITLDQGRLLAEQIGMPVYVGMRNWKPYIADVVKQMRADGVTSMVAICLAPQNSRTSVGLYRRVLEAAADGMKIYFIESWANHPLLADAFAARLQPLWAKLSQETGRPVPVLFTAHSVPTRTVQSDPASGVAGDPYADDATCTAEMVAQRVPELKRWFFAFQSQGMSGGPWLGPTVEETLDAIAAEGHKAVVLQPIGFLCDHVEILYDIDILFRDYAKILGMQLERPETLNTSPLLIKALADLAQQGLQKISTE